MCEGVCVCVWGGGGGGGGGHIVSCRDSLQVKQYSDELDHG